LELGISLSVAVLAVGAQPEYLVGMADECEIKFLRDGFLTLFDPVVYKLDDLSALDADEVIVVRAAECFLVPGAVVLQAGLEDKLALFEYIKRIVNGRPRHFAPRFLQREKELVGVEVTGCSHNRVEHLESFRGHTVVFFPKKFFEMLFRRFHLLPQKNFVFHSFARLWGYPALRAEI
jgi:hypothetical protein